MSDDSNDTLLNKLMQLYEQKSKHSNYQIIPSALSKILHAESVTTNSRYERERLEYILRHLDVKNSSVVDIGANTGYFTFELVDSGAKHVDYYEGNQDHAEFVETAVKYLNLESKISIYNEYYSFTKQDTKKYDIALVFNVLHHVGDDYGNKSLNIESSKAEIIRQLNNMAPHTTSCVFQLGFNLHGDISKPLFENGTKAELIEYVKSGVHGYWSIEDIGIAEEHNTGIKYKSVNQDNIQRVDRLGEFLNRPIFILKSKVL